MQLPQISMQSTSIKTSIQITDPVQKITQPKAVQTIKQPQAIVNMSTTPGKLTIDQTAAWEQMDIKHIFKRTAENAQLGKQKALEGLARRAREGDEMMHIERGGNPIAAQAKEHGKFIQKQTGLGWIPTPFSVKTDYQSANVQFDVQVQKPTIDAQISKPTHDYTPGDVSVSVSQQNSLQINVNNL